MRRASAAGTPASAALAVTVTVTVYCASGASALPN